MPDHCEACGSELTGGVCLACGASDPYRPPRPVERGSSTFSLATLFGLMTLVAVCLGLALYRPIVGGLAALVSVPTVVRASVAIRRKREAGLTVDARDKLWLFGASALVFVLVYAAGGGAFFTTCLATTFGGAAILEAKGYTQYEPIVYGFIAGLIVGSLCGLAALIAAGWYLLPLKRRKR